MAQPTPYSRSTSFNNTFAANPVQVFPGGALDAELNNVKTTLDQTLANLKLLQNDDGTILNGSIGAEQLSVALQIGFTVPTVWASGTAYLASPASTVFENSAFYSCAKSHTSSALFANDLAAGDWVLIANLAGVPLVTAAQIAVTPAGNITQTQVQLALQQLDTLKLNTTTFNALVSSQITDSTGDGRVLLTESLAAQRTTLGGPQIGDIKHTCRLVPDPLWYWADGAAYSRSTFALALSAITAVGTGTLNGTTTISAAAFTANGQTISSLVGMGLEGGVVEGTNIPANATIVSVTSNAIVISSTATGSGTGVALRIFPYGNGDGSTTFNVPKYNGTALVTRDNQGAVTASKVGTVVTDSGTIVGSQLNSAGGSSKHTLAVAESAALTFMTTNGTPVFNSSSSNFQFIGLGVGGNVGFVASGGTNIGTVENGTSVSIPATTTSNAGGGAHAIMQPSTICNTWIFLGA